MNKMVTGTNFLRSNRKNSACHYFLLLAAAFLLLLSLGGEFLHSKLHHHTSQTQHDNCPTVQLIHQAFTSIAFFVALVVTSTCLLLQSSSKNPHKLLSFNLPQLRAPPVFL